MKTTILIIALFMTACSPKKRSEKLYNNNYGIRYFVSKQYELDNDYSLFVFEPQGEQSITIPSSVTSIGANAFYNCYALQSITIPSSVMYWQMLDPYDNSVIAPDSAFYVGQAVFINRDFEIIVK